MRLDRLCTWWAFHGAEVSIVVVFAGLGLALGLILAFGSPWKDLP